MTSKVLVTGGAGFIGSNFIRYALKAHPEWHIINLDKLTYAGNLANLGDVTDHPRYHFVKGDIADRDLVNSLFSGSKNQELTPHMVVNFAAESHVDRSILDAAPFIETNVKGTQVLLEAARAHWLSDLTKNQQPGTRNLFLQVSTDEVYGSIEAGKFSETSPLCPNSPYAASKAAADLLCRAYGRTYGLPVVITRCCNNYGPYQFPEKLIPLMLHRALSDQPLPLYGDGQNVREWIHVEDHCRALDAVLQRGNAGEVYHIGSGEERKNIELVELLCDLIEPKTKNQAPRANIRFIKDRPGHDLRYALDCGKLRQLGWRPAFSLQEGLRKTVDWYLDHQPWVERITSGEYQEYSARVYERGWR